MHWDLSYDANHLSPALQGQQGAWVLGLFLAPFWEPADQGCFVLLGTCAVLIPYLCITCGTQKTFPDFRTSLKAGEVMLDSIFWSFSGKRQSLLVTTGLGCIKPL